LSNAKLVVIAVAKKLRDGPFPTKARLTDYSRRF
jgi:hypothetical protein